MQNSENRYLSIDEDGFFMFDGQRVSDSELGRTLSDNLKVDESGRVSTSMDGKPAWVEAFDAPLIAKEVKLSDSGDTGVIQVPYGGQRKFPLASLTVDEWDRFHGLTENGVPFVMARGAQVGFFDLLDGFDDESVTIRGKSYSTPPWLDSAANVNASPFWSERYQAGTTPWELGHASTVLSAVLPQLKLNRVRVLVLGCGSGHDAAYFAKQGHIVTAVDFSNEAVSRARAQYGNIEGLTFIHADAFELPDKFHGQFDLVFEHTCYCAISPERRNELLRTWKRCLAPYGHLLGVFFAYEKRSGPPFGGSEWELRQRLKEHFDFLYWTRWRQSEESRKGRELIIYARKKGD